MKGEALVDIFHNTVSEVVAKTIADTLTCVVAEAPVKTADTLAVETLGDRLGKVKAEVLVNAQSETLQEVEPETLRNTLAIMTTESLNDALPRRLEENWVA